MIITYKMSAGGGVFKLVNSVVVAFIPASTSNADWNDFLVWQAQGGVAVPADPVPGPTQDEIDSANARAYAKLVALSNKTPAQIQAFIDANVIDIPSAADAIKTLAIAVSVLSRRFILESKV